MALMAIGNQGQQGFNRSFSPFFQAGNRLLITKDGEFVFNGAPTLGNLIYSISNHNTTFTDKYGNAVLPGATNYFNTGGGYVAVQTFGGQIAWYSSVTEAGPWTFDTGLSLVNINSAEGLFTPGPLEVGNVLALQAIPQPAVLGSNTLSAYSLTGTGQLHYVGGDGLDYTTGRKRVVSFTGGTQSITTASFSNVTNASFNVGALHYSIHVRVWLTTSASAGAPQFQLSGPAVSASSFMATFTQTGGASAVSPIGRANSSGLTPGGGITFAGAGSGQIFDAEFDVTFSASGTVNLQALTSIAGDNFVVNTVYIDLSPIN